MLSIKKRTKILIITIFVLFSIICSILFLTFKIKSKETPEFKAKILGITLSNLVDICSETNRGFFNDGLTFIKYVFDKKYADTVTLMEIESSENWHQCPADKAIYDTFYLDMLSISPNNELIQYEILENDDNYWYFKDRFKSTPDMISDTKHNLLNYTFACYDTEEGIIYYFEVDK